jgi:hypothetical protein
MKLRKNGLERSYLRNKRSMILRRIVPIMLTKTIVPRGMKILALSLSKRRSPGRFPNHGKRRVAKRIKTPEKVITSPMTINNFARSVIIETRLIYMQV